MYFEPHPTRKYPNGVRCHVEKLGVRKSALWPTKREATDWGRKVEAEIAAGKSLEFTFSQLCDKYLIDVSAAKRGARWEAYRIEQFREYFGDALLSGIDAPQIGAWRDARLKSHSGSTVQREINLMRNMFQIARKEWHWMEHYPFTGVRLPKQSEARTALWPWQLIKQVLRAPASGKTQEVIDAFHIALRSAMRLQEVLAAPPLFVKARSVVVLTPDKAKSGKREEVPIGRIAAKLLDRPAFKVGANEASTLFAKLTKQLGIDGLTFHDARATALTHLARKVDLMRLAKISRHKDVRVLQQVYYREKADDIAKLI